jgi:single-strand DNA-binding protein
MSSLNKVMLIGNLTRDPETRAFTNGGKVAKFGLAVNERRKNQEGVWEKKPLFLDCEAFNRGDRGTLADRVEQYLRKGSFVFIEGRLQMDEWDDKTTGQKRTKLKIVVDNFEFLDRREDTTGGSYQRPAAAPARRPAAPAESYDTGPEPEMDAPAANRGGEEDIPF